MRKLKKKSLALCAPAGVVCAVLLTMLLCLPFSAAVTRGVLPLASAGLWASLSAGIAVFAATLILARLRGRQALPTAGLIAGGCLFLCALICAGGGSGFAFGPWLAELTAAVLAGGLLGAVMSIRQNAHGKRHKAARK